MQGKWDVCFWYKKCMKNGNAFVLREKKLICTKMRLVISDGKEENIGQNLKGY